jgi:peroxiredoxin
MSDGVRQPLVQVGDPAPEFTLPLANRDGTVSLGDYRGKKPLLLAIFRGLNCAFCRRHIAQLGSTEDRLREAGVDILAVTATPLDRARLYLRYRPVKVALAADPDMTTHRVYGLPGLSFTAELQSWLVSKYRGLARDMGAPLSETVSYPEAVEALGRLDDFEMTPPDWGDRRRGEGLIGQFLIDPGGIVRWSHVEGSTEATGLAGFPSDDELLAAARRG